jgi:hypothetical protein
MRKVLFPLLVLTILPACGAFVLGAGRQDLVSSHAVFAWDSDRYLLTLRAVLVGRDRKCELVAAPSLEREWAVYLVRGNRRVPQVVWTRFREPLWNRLAPGPADIAGLPTRPEPLLPPAMAIDTATAEIPEKLADLIENAWVRMLAGVHDDDRGRAGLDGTMYFVSHWSARGDIHSGSTWSPDRGSRPAALVALGEQMSALAQSTSGSARQRLQAQLEADVRALLDRLK